jgi:hypothetical protein
MAGDVVFPVPGVEARIATSVHRRPLHSRPHEMRCEMSILPLTTEPIFEATTASLSSGLANTQRIHALALTDKWLS